MQPRIKHFSENINIRISNGFSRKSLFALLLFFTTFLFAQKTEISGQNLPSTIFFSNGAQIFSDDAVFNAEIACRKITVKNAVVSQSKNGTVILSGKSYLKIALKKKKKPQLTVRDRTNIISSSLAKQLKNLHERKGKQNLPVIFHNASSETYFTAGYSVRHFSILNHHDFSKGIFSGFFYYENIQLLSFQYTEVNYYSTTQLSYCSSEAFSLRPPPFLA